MNEELQRALYALVAAGLAPDLPVFGFPPDNQPLPYVVLGEPQSQPADTTDSNGELVRVPVRIFTRASTLAQATEAVDRVRALLHHTEGALSLTKGTAVTMYIEGSSVEEPSEEGKARETVVTVAILVDDIITGTD